MKVIHVSEETLKQWLQLAERDWRIADSHTGVTEGGLEGAIERGSKDTKHIREMRELIKTCAP